MNAVSIHLASALALGLLAAPVVAEDLPYQGEGHVMAAPADLTWTESPSLPRGTQIAVIEGSLKEAEPITFRIRVPANTQIPVHTHPTHERVTVLSGSFHLGLGDKFEPAKAERLTAGSIAILPPDSPMFAYTGNEETVIQVHGMGPWGITYLNPEDDPSKRQAGK